MAHVQGKNTGPELVVRKLAYNLGYRYRIHGKYLPGRPDIVFSSHRKVVFVNGCFWHMHRGCRNLRMPKSRVLFWRKKLICNKSRDSLSKRRLSLLGWKYLVIWECQLTDKNKLIKRLKIFLEEA
jgi:DNA mismatch endonuclease (patch repair protein)